MPTPHPPRRGIVFALVLLVAWGTSSGAAAEPVGCFQGSGYVIEVENLGGDVPASSTCGGFHCQAPIHLGNEIFLTDPFCDPTAGPCSVTISASFEFPGNADNVEDGGSSVVPRLYYFDSASAPDCTPTFFDNCGAFTICGAPGGPQFLEDVGRTLITRGGISCDNVGSTPDVLSLTAWRCLSSSCRQHADVDGLAFGGPEVAAAIGCPIPAEPPPEACNGDASCRSCPVGGAGVGGGGPADTAGGPGATLRYKAGGPGTPGLPGASSWAAELGTGWSYDYAQRIIQDPDATHVWLITPFGTFREFTDGNADGLYEVAAPSDEYRTLTHDAATGWELTGLDGLVQRFDTSGRWRETEDRNGNTTTATYDASGRLTRVDFPDGRAETFAYHPDAKLASITEVGVDGTTSRTWSLTWTGDDLTRLERPDGTALEYVYDEAAHPGFVTRKDLVGSSGGRRVLRAWAYDPQGNVAATWRGDVAQDGPDAVDLHTLSYDDPFEPTVTTVTDPLGQAAVYSFDRDPASSKVRMTTISGDCPVCGLGPSSSFTYDDANNPLLPTTITDGLGRMEILEYDAQGQTISRTEAAGTPVARTTTWGYDVTYPALVAAIERPSVDGGASVRTTTFVRDASGNVTERIETGVEAGAGFTLSTLTSYEASGEALTVDPPGFGTSDATSFTYDATRGHLVAATRTDPLIGTTTFTHDAFNRRTEITDPNGVTTATSYDPLDRVTEITQEGATAAEDLVTTQVYNEFGDLLRTVLPRGNVIEYGYDPAGRLVTIERKPDAATPAERTLFTLDAVGNRVAEKLQRWDGAQWVTEAETAFTYTSRCHLDAVTRAPGTSEASTTSFSYDCNGNLAETWDENHDPATDAATTVHTYDELDRLVAVTQPWGGEGGGDVVTTYGYDAQDHLISVTDGEGNTTTYEYSDRDLLTLEDSPVSGLTQHLYNAHGELVETTDARGVTMTRTVDELDRVTFVDYPGTDLDTTFVYDDPMVDFSIGRLTAIERHGQSVDYSYDRFGRVTQDGELSYDHDKNGNRVEIGYPGGVTATYTYDFADRPSTLDVQVGADPVQPVVTSSSYLPSGPLSSLGLANGLTETRSFDSRYAPAGIEVAGRLEWTYTTDGVGNVLTITDALDASQNRTYTYQDVQYFLTQGNGPWGDLSWSYDHIGNRLTETRDGTTDTYAYVANASDGNTALLDQITLGVGGTRDYTHGPAGHLTRVTAGAHQVNLEIDSAGRLAAFERPAADSRSDLTYDGRGFLTHAAEPGEIFSDGFESGDFSCWSNVVGGTKGGTCPDPPAATGSDVVEPVYDSEGLLRSRRAEAGDVHVLYFAGRPVALLEVAGGLVFLTTDHLGTPVLATDETGAATWAGGFEPFGRDWNGASQAGVFLRLPGQWTDPAWEDASLGAEAYYNVYRWYEPGIGRYTKTDPLGLLGGDLALYRYAQANPLFWIDPRGLVTCVLFVLDPLAEVGSFKFGVVGHVALFVGDETCASSSSSLPFTLYDPGGSYRPKSGNPRGSGDIFFGSDANLADYIEFHEDGGSIVELYCFDTSCCDEQAMVDRAEALGGVAGGLCSAAVGTCIKNLGPFKDEGSGFPGVFRRRIRERPTLFRRAFP